MVHNTPAPKRPPPKARARALQTHPSQNVIHQMVRLNAPFGA
jgi:hypothetical protein